MKNGETFHQWSRLKMKDKSMWVIRFLLDKDPKVEAMRARLDYPGATENTSRVLSRRDDLEREINGGLEKIWKSLLDPEFGTTIEVPGDWHHNPVAYAAIYWAVAYKNDDWLSNIFNRCVSKYNFYEYGQYVYSKAGLQYPAQNRWEKAQKDRMMDRLKGKYANK